MVMDSSSDWELSKENFQPLRTGRKAAALQPRANKEIQDEKREFEANLRTFSGPDSLQPWYEYVLWVEQNYPKGGKDGNLSTLLEKCIQEFKNDPVVCQDHRYLEVWLKYVAMVQKPLDIFQFMNANNQCTKVPEFYVAWAWELEQAAKFKEAEMAFRAGLELVDDGDRLDSIEAKHRQFQARVMKRMVDDDVTTLHPPEETRSALGTLQGHGRHGKVGSVRVGSAKKSDQPGVLPMLSSSISNQKNNGRFAVFQDVDQQQQEPEQLPTRKSSLPKKNENLPFNKNQEQENELNPGKWTKSNIGRKSHSVALDKISSVPAFAVHEDHDENDDRKRPLATPHKSNVLSVKKQQQQTDVGEHDVPVALFEPFDPNRKPMYCKHLVYQGVTELSFEELRAAKYWKKVKEDEMVEKQRRLEKMMVEVLEERNRIADEQENWKRKQRKEMERHKEELMQWQKEEFQKMMRKLTSQPPETASKSSILESTANLLQADSNPNSLDKTPNCSRGTTNASLLTKPSPTVNTREAFNLVRKMWCGDGPQPQAEARPEREDVGFSVYQDGEEMKDEAKFTIYQDHEEVDGAREDAKTAPFAVCCDDDDGVKENVSPASCQKDERERLRKKSGILLESESVPFVRLETQERVLDQDELEQLAVADREDATIKLPSMADFEQMARMASTPFHGRRFVPEEDENTCAVQIVFKKPLSPEPEPEEEPRKCESIKAVTAAADVVQEHVEYPQLQQMSPIMETSREHNYKSSSSSSNSSQSQWHLLTKSQWGNNTDAPMTNKPGAQSSMTVSRTPGTMMLLPNKSLKPNEVTTSSGYMADASSARTPGDFLLYKNNAKTTLPSHASQPSKRTKINMNFVAEDDEEDGDEVTAGLFNGIMSEFQRNAGIDVSSPLAFGRKKKEDNNVKRVSNSTSLASPAGCLQSSFLQQSLKASFLTESQNHPRGEVEFESFLKPPTPVADASGLFNASTGQQSKSLSIEVTATPPPPPPPDVDLTRSVHHMDGSILPVVADDELDLATDGVAGLSLRDFDYRNAPFSRQLHALLLREIDLGKRHGYFEVERNVPQVKVGGDVKIGPYKFIVAQCKGEGSFGKVFGAVRQDLGDGANETISNMDVVLKVQKPKNVWEFYVCTELHNRLESAAARDWFMSIPRCFVYENGSVFVSEQHACTLLDVINVVNSGQMDGRETREILASYFLVEMLTVLEHLHGTGIIHGDIKPDNFLMQRIPTANVEAGDVSAMFARVRPSLILIDFGVSVDMTLLPRDTEFRMVFEKKDRRTPEMLEGKDWSFQIDYFGVTSIVYSILHGTHIKINKKENGEYEQEGKFKRWWSHHVWEQFFHDFLNIENSKKLPDLVKTKWTFQELLYTKHRAQFFTVANKLGAIMHGRF